MIRSIHEKLTEALKLQTPEGENVVDTLISIAPMSKEAAYRRLRGEIQFTLTEASRISRKLHISIDRMAGIDKKDTYMFHLKNIFTDEPFERYYDLLNTSLSVFRQVKQDPNTMFLVAGNIFPYAFYNRYPFLSKFAFFKWFYQTSYSYGATKRLKDVVIPKKVTDIQQELLSEVRQVNSSFIIGDDIVLSLVNDVKYFAAINLLTPDEVVEMKENIILMLDYMEKTTRDGCFLTTEKKALIYVSNAYLDGNYSYLSSTYLKASTIYLFGINQLNCIDPTICEYQKAWFESLIAYSTLISGSGKLQGTIFFNQQRELLNTI